MVAFEGRQQELHLAFDGEPAWAVFNTYYRRSMNSMLLEKVIAFRVV
jgi:hypothetical protein